MAYSFLIPEDKDDFGEPVSHLQNWLDKECDIYWTTVVSTTQFVINIVDQDDALRFALFWGIKGTNQ